MSIFKHVTFDGWDPTDELGAVLEEYTIGIPDPVTAFVEVPGRTAPLDYTDAYGVTYGMRTLEFVYGIKGPQNEREPKIDIFLAQLSAKRKKIACEWIQGLFSGRVVRMETEHQQSWHSTVTIEVAADPYRYDENETTVTTTATVAGETVTLSNGQMPAVPQFVTEDTVTITWDGGTYQGGGTFQIPALVLQQGDTDITITGSGAVTITYQQGRI